VTKINRFESAATVDQLKVYALLARLWCVGTDTRYNASAGFCKGQRSLTALAVLRRLRSPSCATSVRVRWRRPRRLFQGMEILQAIDVLFLFLFCFCLLDFTSLSTFSDQDLQKVITDVTTLQRFQA